VGQGKQPDLKPQRTQRQRQGREENRRQKSRSCWIGVPTLLTARGENRQGRKRFTQTWGPSTSLRMTASFDDGVFCDWVQRILNRRIR
jgi:hypothetical protein